MINFKAEVAQILSSKVEELTIDEIIEMIEMPPDRQMGDYAFPCFKLAKLFRKAPNMIAKDIVDAIGENSLFSKVENMAVYVNFFVD